MAVPRRIRSSAKARRIRRRRTVSHFFLALVAALLVSSWTYRTSVDQAAAIQPPVSQVVAHSLDQAALAASIASQPPASPAPKETATATVTSSPTLAPSQTSSPAPALPTATPAEALPTNGPTSLPGVIETPTGPTQAPPILYYSQAGDTLQALAIRFGVDAANIHSPDPIPPTAFIPPNQLLMIPPALDETTNNRQLLPDSELVYSPTAINFDIDAFASQAGGYLGAQSRQYMSDTGWMNGPDVVQRVATENSINPRLLLALLELRAHWVYGQPSNLAEQLYPINANLDALHKNIYYQLTWTVTQLQVGYYSWREGRLTVLTFPDGTSRRLAPGLNAGTVALQYLFSKIENEAEWNGDLYGPQGFGAVYEKMFGSPWVRDQSLGSLFPTNLTQPMLTLPFIRGQLWSLTGGPHSAWIPEDNGGWAALDFAPSSTESGCIKSDMWVVSPAAGLVVRSDHGVVMLDLDGDGHEQTGWVIMFLHIATDGRVAKGKWVDPGDLIGHPSCEGGNATGTHVHIARKYNGEWIAADGPLPFTMSGFVAHAGAKPYQGYLTKGTQKILACSCSSFETNVIRPLNDP